MVTDRLSLKLSIEPLNLLDCYQFALDATCGAVHTFVGTVRNHHLDKQVTHLEFEAYREMAIGEMKKIAKEAFTKWPCKKMAIHHRIGRTHIKEAAVIIAVSTPHRQEGFQACAFVIDQLKKTVPIWKKECYQNGEVWVGATP